MHTCTVLCCTLYLELGTVLRDRMLIERTSTGVLSLPGTVCIDGGLCSLQRQYIILRIKRWTSVRSEASEQALHTRQSHNTISSALS